MTLTIELSDEAAAQIQAAAEARGQDVSTFAIDALIAAADEDTDPDIEIVAAAIESVDDARAGRLFTLEEADARFERDYAEARARVRAQIRAGVSPVAHLSV